MVTAGYVLQVVLGWSSLVRRVWDWKLDQWRLSLRDLPSLLRQTHPILASTDTALYELTPQGAAARNRLLTTHASSIYATLPGMITHGPEALPLPSAPPLYALLAVLNAASGAANGEVGRQSDGIVPLASQRFPAGHPNCHVAQLNSRRSSCSQAGGGGRDADELQVAQLRGRLRRGTWSWADAAPVAHGRSALYVGSELFEHAIRVVVPAIAEETARTRAAGDGSD